MDPVGHYMLSWLLGRRMNLEKNAYRALLLGSLLPDLDVITLILGFDFLLEHHSTISHSLVLWLFLAGAISLLLRSQSLFPYLLLGAYLHISADILLNTGLIFKGGVWCLWPFSKATCLLAYNTDIPILAFRATYVSLEVLLYSAALYFIWKKEYPWGIWLRWER
jgi:hypothetical protein